MRQARTRDQQREDDEKFKRRVALSHYPNYIAPAIDVPLSFLFRKDPIRVPLDMGEAMNAWMDDVDGSVEVSGRRLIRSEPSQNAR